MTDTPFAERLRAIMGAKRVSRKALGNVCGKTPQAVQRWCDGSAMPSSGDFIKICNFLGCSHEWLFSQYHIDWESAELAPQGRHAKYWVREAIAELRMEGLL